MIFYHNQLIISTFLKTLIKMGTFIMVSSSGKNPSSSDATDKSRPVYIDISAVVVDQPANIQTKLVLGGK